MKKDELKINISFAEFEKALEMADSQMKENNGHSFITILKTRCVYCGKSPKVKTRCGAWFQTFIDNLKTIMLNSEEMLKEKE